jgi:hypothetical protein
MMVNRSNYARLIFKCQQNRDRNLKSSKFLKPYPDRLISFSAIADLVGWVKECNPTMRNDNLIVESLQSLSDEVRTPILLARKY